MPADDLKAIARKAARSAVYFVEYEGWFPNDGQTDVPDACADAVLAAIAEHYGDRPGHVIEFTASGWTIQHPLACRPDLFTCPVNRVAETDLRKLDGPPAPPGRYECELNDIGDRLLIGDRIDPPERP